MSRTVYVNGVFTAEEDAKISVFDRGFLFADAVYEVSSVLRGRMVDNAAHLARLRRSLAELQLPSPGTDEEIVAVQQELITRNSLSEGVVYLQVSRGIADRDFAYPQNTPASLVMFTQARPLIDSPSAKTGISVVTRPDIRWQRRDIKTVGLLAACMAKQAALDAGAQDAWLVEDGFVTEGSSNNAFIVDQSGVLRTRHLGSEILHGITRAAVLRLCANRALSVREAPFAVADALAAREAFITSASAFVCPVVNIDGQAIGDGKPGPVARQLRELYVELALGEP